MSDFLTAIESARKYARELENVYGGRFVIYCESSTGAAWELACAGDNDKFGIRQPRNKTLYRDLLYRMISNLYAALGVMILSVDNEGK